MRRALRSRVLPPDRGHVATEQRHAHSAAFDTLTTREAIAVLVDDHAAVLDAMSGAAPALETWIDIVVARLHAGGRLVYLGAGTSGRLGVLDASECPPTFQSDPAQVVGIIAGGDAALRRSSEAKEDDPDGARDAIAVHDIGAHDAVLGIAAGGTTPWVRGALTRCAARGAATALLTCAPETVRPEGCDHLIVLDTGPEILTGSTRLKAGTATKLALNAITTIAFTRLGKVHGNLMVDLRATNAKLLDRAIRIVRVLHPEMDRAETAARLDDAGGSVKTALVMVGCACDRAEAERRLGDAQGVLRAALDGR